MPSEQTELLRSIAQNLEAQKQTAEADRAAQDRESYRRSILGPLEKAREEARQRAERDPSAENVSLWQHTERQVRAAEKHLAEYPDPPQLPEAKSYDQVLTGLRADVERLEKEVREWEQQARKDPHNAFALMKFGRSRAELQKSQERLKRFLRKKR